MHWIKKSTPGAFYIKLLTSTSSKLAHDRVELTCKVIGDKFWGSVSEKSWDEPIAVFGDETLQKYYGWSVF